MRVTSLGRIAVICAVAVVAGFAGAALFLELDVTILAVPFVMLQTVAGWALVIVGLLAAFRRWGRTPDAASGPNRSAAP